MAGVFDAQGCVQLARQGRYLSRKVFLEINSENKEQLCSIQNVYGGAIRETGDGYRWKYDKNRAYYALEDIRPYLKIKRRQACADLVLDRYPVFIRGSGRAESDRRWHIEDIQMALTQRNRPYKSTVRKRAHRKTTKDDHLYAAGLFDCLGSLNAQKATPIEVWHRDAELLEWLQSRFGGRTYKHDRPGKNLIFSWRVAKKDSKAMMKKVWPYMNVPARKNIAEEISKLPV